MDELPTLESLHFFSLSQDLLRFEGKRGDILPKSHMLSFPSAFFSSPPFAKVFMGWSPEGLFFQIISESKSPHVFFPDIQKGDCVEIFLDTRDMKKAPAIHKFCHHFFFLPFIFESEGEKIQCGEITRFRGEEKHELADPEHIFVMSEELRQGYVMKIFIPKEALFGYEPLAFHRMGFTYRINRVGGVQYFAVSAEEYPIEKYPALWATLKIVK